MARTYHHRSQKKRTKAEASAKSHRRKKARLSLRQQLREMTR